MHQLDKLTHMHSISQKHDIFVVTKSAMFKIRAIFFPPARSQERVLPCQPCNPFLPWEEPYCRHHFPSEFSTPPKFCKAHLELLIEVGEGWWCHQCFSSSSSVSLTVDTIRCRRLGIINFIVCRFSIDTSAVFVTDVKKNDEKRNGVNGTSLLRAILSGSEATPRTLSWVSWLAMMHYSWGSWFIQLGFRATLFHSHPIPFCNWGTQQGAWGWQTSQGTDGRRCDRKATTLAAKLSWLLTPTHSQFRTRS